MLTAHRCPTLLFPGGHVGGDHVENCDDAIGREDGGSNAREEGETVVRTRTVPAGPHPYLDRFASGMHRPFEGQRRFFLSRVRYKCGTLEYGNWNALYYFELSRCVMWAFHFIS